MYFIRNSGFENSKRVKMSNMGLLALKSVLGEKMDIIEEKNGFSIHLDLTLDRIL